MSDDGAFERYAATHLSDQAEHLPAPARVSFGPKEWQSMEIEVASMLLTLWRERAPATFGAYLAEVLTGTKPGRKTQL